MITCYVRYVLDMNQVEAFAEYGRLWMTLVDKLGGTHHGYYVPSRDPKAANHGRFSFPGIGSEGPAGDGDCERDEVLHQLRTQLHVRGVLVLRWRLEPIDDDHVNRRAHRVEPQPQLLLKRAEDRPVLGR